MARGLLNHGFLSEEVISEAYTDEEIEAIDGDLLSDEIAAIQEEIFENTEKLELASDALEECSKTEIEITEALESGMNDVVAAKLIVGNLDKTNMIFAGLSKTEDKIKVRMESDTTAAAILQEGLEDAKGMMASIKDFIAKIWKGIKDGFAWIWKKMKEFWIWITGQSQKSAEKAIAAAVDVSVEIKVAEKSKQIIALLPFSVKNEEEVDAALSGDAELKDSLIKIREEIIEEVAKELEVTVEKVKVAPAIGNMKKMILHAYDPNLMDNIVANINNNLEKDKDNKSLISGIRAIAFINSAQASRDSSALSIKIKPKILTMHEDYANNFDVSQAEKDILSYVEKETLWGEVERGQSAMSFLIKAAMSKKDAGIDLTLALQSYFQAFDSVLMNLTSIINNLSESMIKRWGDSNNTYTDTLVVGASGKGHLELFLPYELSGTKGTYFTALGSYSVDFKDDAQLLKNIKVEKEDLKYFTGKYIGKEYGKDYIKQIIMDRNGFTKDFDSIKSGLEHLIKFADGHLSSIQSAEAEHKDDKDWNKMKLNMVRVVSRIGQIDLSKCAKLIADAVKHTDNVLNAMDISGAIKEASNNTKGGN